MTISSIHLGFCVTFWIKKNRLENVIILLKLKKSYRVRQLVNYTKELKVSLFHNVTVPF